MKKIKKFIAWLQFKLRKKHKRLYVVYNSDGKEFIGLRIRGLPRRGMEVIAKGGADDVTPRHFGVQVLNIFKLTKDQKYASKLPLDKEAYYVDGKYNDLEIKRIY